MFSRCMLNAHGLEYRGNAPKVRWDIRENKILEALIEKPKGFNELYTEVASGWNKRDLSKCLRELNSDFLVDKIEVSGKVKQGKKKAKYISTKTWFGSDYESFHMAFQRDKKQEQLVKDVIEELKQRQKLDEPHALAFIDFVILTYLRDLLDGIKTVARVNEKFRTHARRLLNKDIERLGKLIIEMGHLYLESLESSFQKWKGDIQYNLEKYIEAITGKKVLG